ncbi:monoamine oxidase [Marinactinospora thermotolerans DSM 45154]|uniref:Monoamine oxidase n=1 Tax=Marinactinospora thermotolerans DSM 45154 TaxID=1122192 RepID=A0A1T4JXE7_9ACTN|nr:FAD-dependent oxidoreductase [Marinactinospora thermotolerans]SJZ34798.1 monoamine oxidase [Marinactinospora thermotolerans DSM 45154]
MEHARVVVVGGGVSGLVAARALHAHGVHGVVVLEGADRPGGRATEGLLPGSAFVREHERGLLELADELGVPVDPLAHDPTLNDLRVDEEGGIELSDDNLPLDLSWWSRIRGGRLLDRLTRLAAGIDPTAPWLSPRAEELDSQTARSWLRAHSSDCALLDLIEEHLTTEAGLPADRISMLWLLAHLGPRPGDGKDLLRLDPVLLTDRLSAGAGAAVRTGHHVGRVDQDHTGVRVHGPWGSIAADHLIMAISPADARHIEFTPSLPSSRWRMQQQWPQAEIIQTEVVYWRPFWRNFGLSGQVHFDDGIPAWTMDNSPGDSSQGRLLAHTYTFGEADPLGADQEVIDEPARHRGLLLDNLVLALGPLAAQPLSYSCSKAGGGRYSRAYRCPAPPGFLTEYGPLLRRPVGRIHWASTETAPFPENGNLSGALSSGLRAATEVAAAGAVRCPGAA